MQLFFREYGQGAPLVILHGLFGSSENWHGLAQRLGGHFHVFIPDLRDHGQSPHAGEITYPLMAADVAEFMDARGVAVAEVIGHSMGGKVAMQLALNQPERVKRLVVADMSPRSYTPLHSEIIAALVSLDVASYASRTEIEEALAGAIPSLTMRRFLLKNLGRGGDGRFAWKINLAGLADGYPQLREAATGPGPYLGPALFIRGARSEYIRAEGEPSIPEWFPHSEVKTIENAGHWIHAEAPDEFLRLVLDFLH